MKSKHIPSSLEAAKKAAEMVKNQIAALEISTATKKRPSLQDKLNKERLQGLLYADTLNDDEIEILASNDLYFKGINKYTNNTHFQYYK